MANGPSYGADDGEDDVPPPEALAIEQRRMIGGAGRAALFAGPGMPGMAGGPRRCLLCGRREDRVRHLVRARGVHLCDGCIDQAQQAIAGAEPDQRIVRFRPERAQVADHGAAERAIEDAFETAFDSSRPVEQRCAVIEAGGNLGGAMREVAQRMPHTQDIDAEVDRVRFLGDDEAEVGFTLVMPGIMAGGMQHTGYAVLDGGTWKVARQTWCGLAGMTGVICPPPD